jgi:hypothetical protein
MGVQMEKPEITKTQQGETGDEQVQIIFFDIREIVHKEFVLAGQTVSSTYHCDILL